MLNIIQRVSYHDFEINAKYNKKDNQKMSVYKKTLLSMLIVQVQGIYDILKKFLRNLGKTYTFNKNILNKSCLVQILLYTH